MLHDVHANPARDAGEDQGPANRLSHADLGLARRVYRRKP